LKDPNVMHSNLWQEVKHFRQNEFDSEDRPGSGINMKPRVVFMVDALRGLLGRSFRVNSGFRTPEHNRAEGGAPQSAHLTGEAVDIGTRGWTERERCDLVLYALKLGFSGIGIAKTFVHLDVKARRASWRYSGGKTIAIPVGDELKYI